MPCSLALAGVQPLLGAAAGNVAAGWAAGLALPALGAAALVFGASRVFDRGDAAQPPWYSAWALLPGAFLLAGAAAMCIFGALVELSLIVPAMWVLLASGTVAWGAAMALVARASR